MNLFVIRRWKTEAMHRFLPILGLVCLAVCAQAAMVWEQSIRTGWTDSHRLRPLSAEELAAEIAETERIKKIRAGGRHHKALQRLVEFPGVKNPELIRPENASLPDSTPVVGVEVDGAACAFVLSAMNDPSRHIVNLMINQKPVSVTYCNYADCVRVLSQESNQPISLQVGGLDVDNQMVFLFQDQRYGQQSRAIPLSDYPFQRTTLGDWQQAHPETLVYVGDVQPS